MGIWHSVGRNVAQPVWRPHRALIRLPVARKPQPACPRASFISGRVQTMSARSRWLNLGAGPTKFGSLNFLLSVLRANSITLIEYVRVARPGMEETFGFVSGSSEACRWSSELASRLWPPKSLKCSGQSASQKLAAPLYNQTGGRAHQVRDARKSWPSQLAINGPRLIVRPD